MSRPASYDWVVLNQSQSPAFQRLMERITGPGRRALMVTGMPHPMASGPLEVEAAPAYDRRGLKARASSWLRFMAAAGARAARLRGRPFLFVATNPPMLPHLAWALRRARGLRYAVLVWDLYPDAMVHQGMTSASSPMARAFRELNRRAFRGAEAVIVLSERMGELVRAQVGDAPVRIEVIPNWGDTETIRPLPKADNPFALAHGQADRVTVMYSGNIGQTHGLTSVVQAAARLQGDERVGFLVIGDGLGRPAVEAEVERLSLAGRVRLVDYQPWEMLPLTLATGDIAIVAQAPGTEDHSFPSKTYQALAAGSAILALTSPTSDLARLVEEHDVGATVARDDVDAIEATLRGWLDDPSRLEQLRSNARRVAVERFSEDAVARRFLEVLGPHIGGPQGSQPATGQPRQAR